MILFFALLSLSSRVQGGPDDCFKDGAGPKTQGLSLKIALPAKQPKWQDLEVKFSCLDDGSEQAEIVNEVDFSNTFGTLAEVEDLKYASGYRMPSHPTGNSQAPALNPVLAIDVENPKPHRKFRLIFRWKEARYQPGGYQYIPFFRYAYLSFHATYQVYRWDKEEEDFKLETKEELPLLVDLNVSRGTVSDKKVKISVGRVLTVETFDRDLCPAVLDLHLDARSPFQETIPVLLHDCAKDSLTCQEKGRYGNQTFLGCEANFPGGRYKIDLVKIAAKKSHEVHLLRSHDPRDNVWKMPE